ncbi:hypothetical protein [Petroclostridium sp. X23]|uniref:hypothetical protein n=1 Tax=Petroclostridium sp. X23 TaxID=3045146 RepID=UPI0024AD3C2F|nr:hypothetical protein [Petroclostridium sp. X23]WHH59388.1 hypothetical protein QKW49_01040 [Petroclostridium sp. X23]
MRREKTKSATVSIKFCEFEMPPMQDILILGKYAPIGTEAARRMADVLSPDQYEVIKVEHTKIEAIVVRRKILSIISRNQLTKVVIEEVEDFISDSTVFKANINIEINVKRSIEL